MATHGSEAYPNDDTTKHDDGTAGAHYGSNDAHHPAASHGSHYNGGSAGAHHGSNDAHHPAASYGSHYNGGSAGTHHGSNGAHHPAASYGSHYSGGSAGTHHGSNHAPCDATYCPEKCAKYYHCQFEHSQTPDCADAPDDCAARCAGCPPPTAEHGSNYGSNHGSDYDTVGVVGSHGGQYSDTPMHDKLPGEHSAPTCLHNCF